MRTAMITALLAAFALSDRSFAQGLVLKHIHSSTTHQEIFASEHLEYRNSIVRYNSWDFNGDGAQDYVATERQVGTQSWNLKVYDSEGFDVLWTSEGEISPRLYWDSAIFIDFTGDGIKELVYCDPSEIEVYIYSINLHQNILSQPGSSNYLILDFDSDGVLDLGLYTSVAPEEYRYEIWGAGEIMSAPPSNLVVLPDGDNLELNWNQVDSCSMYRILWAFSLTGEYASIGTSAIPSFTHPGASIAPAAFYRVTAITSTNGEQVIAQAHYERPVRRIDNKGVTK